MKLGLIMGVLVFTAACGARWENRSKHPTVYVDDSFDAAGMQGIAMGLEKWMTADTTLRPKLVLVAHATLLDDANLLRYGDAVYIANLDSFNDPSCPTKGIRRLRNDPNDAPTNTDGFWGRTWSFRDQSVICIYAPVSEAEAEGRSDADFISRVAGHEMGHAYGLGHRTDVPSIMHPNTERQSGFVTEVDVADVESALRSFEP